MKIALLIMTGIGFTLGVVFGLLLQLPIDTLPADAHNIRSQRPLSAPTGSFRSRRSLLHGDGENPQPPPVDLDKLQSGLGASNGREEKVANSNLVRENTGTASPHRGNGVNSSSSSSSYPTSSGRMAASRMQLRKNPGPNGNSADHQENPRGASHRFNSRTKDGLSSQASSLGAEGREFGAVGRDLGRHSKDTRQESAGSPSPEDLAYLATIVEGVSWSPRLEASCPRPFSAGEVDAWRRRTADMDVVRVEDGCGRMQNRLVTFRDSSRACARYRLNTDQIQGEVFSYYLARLLNVSHIPPTALARVDSRSPRWRSVHLQLSLAQWADSKLVVLTKFIDGMAPAHIPPEFRGEGEDALPGHGGVANFNTESSVADGEGRKGTEFRTNDKLPAHFKPKVTPTVAGLGSKSRAELCQLLQWSDLIVFDYLTANLDRVINNMFNRQWNDQMMASPAHNLEQRADGALVFLDNESGLFHGYRLLDKYAGFHRSLLAALCVFRPATVDAVKRLRASRSVGRDLHELFVREEPELHEQLAPLPEKNIKVLQQRLEDVYNQIVACEKVYGGAGSDTSSNRDRSLRRR